jgi:16S rRNA (cytosine967-C5)-methyltransferase
MAHPPISARAQAHRLLQRVLAERQTLDAALARHPLTGTPEDQAFTMRLARTVLQHIGQIDAVIAPYLEKSLPPKRIAVTNALRLGVAQLLCLNTPAHAAVHASVALVKPGKDAALAGLVNAVLKRVAQASPSLPSPLCNVPPWLRVRWEAAYGAPAVAAMAQLSLQDARIDLTYADGRRTRLAPDHPPVEQLPGYSEGAFIVQDIAASYPVALLGDVARLRVLDVCAAPGGKTAQLVWAGAQVTALDRSAHRLERLHANMARLRLTAETVVADACVWQPAAPFDAILLDAPCTATGTWRRHPEVVHLLTPEAIAEMAALQQRLLLRAWEWLKPGGRLVYAVCSLEAEEGEAQAEWFAAQRPDAQCIPAGADIPEACRSAEGYVRTRADVMQESGGMDGFFAVCWQKREF